jgi:hypothetical protein
MARREFRAETRVSGLYRLTRSDILAAVSEVRKGGGDQFGTGYRKFDHVLRAVGQQLERLSDQIEALSLGARASDYTWFRRNFPPVGANMRAGGGADLFTIPAQKPITRPVYLRGLEFVTTTALHWQEFPQPVVTEEDS